RAGNYVIQGLARRLAHGRLAQHHHVLRSPHAVHHVHDGERECRHNLVTDHGFRIAFEQRYVNAVVYVLLVQQGNRRGQVQPSPEQRRAMAYAVQSVAITYQDPQWAFRSRRRDMNRNLAEYSFAAIWTKDGFNGDVVSWARFGEIGAGALQTCGAAVADKVEIQLHPANIRHVVGIIVNTAEA